METRRWTNPSQPQTLYMATFLLYINAAFNVLFGAIFTAIGLVLVIGEVAGGFGIANEKRWGYYLGVGVATLGLLPILLTILANGVGSIFSVALILNALFPVALFALLVHPMSREDQKIWFH
jgi:uncharacterized membrane protein (DUF2068 family)